MQNRIKIKCKSTNKETTKKLQRKNAKKVTNEIKKYIKDICSKKIKLVKVSGENNLLRK
jgi:hypothetical protein